MSWHFSRALVGEYWGATCSDGAPFAPSNGNPTPQLYLPKDRMTAFSRLSRFGMTFGLLTDDLGAELLTWYRAGFPVRTSAPRGGGQGLDGERSGLWREMARIIGEVRPSLVLVENSPMLTLRGLDVVLGDLAAMGFDAKWGVVSAANAGLAHERERIWILAYPMQDGFSGILAGDNAAQDGRGRQAQRGQDRKVDEVGASRSPIPPQRKDQPPAPELVDGVADWVDQLEALGNGQVPAVVRLAWEVLT